CAVIQNIVNKNTFATANIIRGILKDKTGINISKQTLIRDMNRNGIRPYVFRKKPALRKVNITKKHQFSIKYCGMVDSFWENVISSDECKFEMYPTNKKVRVYRCKGGKFKKQHIVGTSQNCGYKVMA
ncbi:putative transposable element, partial [Pseudoloma neurophilia]